ncbi:membrane protein insertion efficiency factor YidD [uncultured Desulfuromonas sp.]|uniref:membrane protein insertion efficiency factor YidD n=1 Tax=uncultured Desulfuromonas sp. TaxID=181013 RepID=UPI002AAC3BEE|nr:membrane protein insertion efficiency factor YidD [uncultured Desulfuromonas sp.]
MNTNPLVNLSLFLIKVYQRTISPLTPPSCRFIPTCSEYAILSIKKYGFFVGVFKSILRILRCNPLFKGGYDPVK